MKPAVVLTMGRSGSSMVARALASQGFWTGRCKPGDEHNPRGYFENARLSVALGRLYPGSIYSDLRPMSPPRRWRQYVQEVLRAEGHERGPWLVKVNAFTWPVWLPFDPVLVFVYRDVDAIVRSAMKHDPRAMLPARWRQVALAHHAEMRRVEAAFGGFRVEAERLVDGDVAQIAKIVHVCGLSLDERALRASLEPDLWHHRQ